MTLPGAPDIAVRIAIKVLLNHVEPGWENTKAVVQAWLEGKLEGDGLVQKVEEPSAG